MEGWIKLHRSCLDHWIYNEYRPLTRREAWETMLFTVNYEDKKALIKGQLYDCNRGQSLLSLQNWAEKFVWSIRNVRTFFKLLESDGMIICEGLQYTTRLTICNYDIYQDSRQADDKPMTSRRQADDKPPTTTKEREEYKERKEKSIGEKSTRFIPPTIEEIKVYCLERKNDIKPEKFQSFYEAKNWMIGKNKMKDWRAAVRNWENNEKQNSNATNQQKNGNEIKPYNNGFFDNIIVH